MTEEEIVIFDSYADPIKANIVKGLLDSYGIECFLTDENMAGLYAPYTPAIGGVKLNVFEKDIAQIVSVLNSENSGTENRSFEHDENQISCPKCHSENVANGDSSKKKFGLWILYILSWIFVFPFYSQPLNKRKAFHCFDCDNYFDNL